MSLEESAETIFDILRVLASLPSCVSLYILWTLSLSLAYFNCTPAQCSTYILNSRASMTSRSIGTSLIDMALLGDIQRRRWVTFLTSIFFYRENSKSFVLNMMPRKEVSLD